MNREEYEKDLAERQRKHLENVRAVGNNNWSPCLHDTCPACHGTGIKIDGSMCIHNIACSCPKCTPYCSVDNPTVKIDYIETCDTKDFGGPKSTCCDSATYRAPRYYNTTMTNGDGTPIETISVCLKCGRECSTRGNSAW